MATRRTASSVRGINGKCTFNSNQIDIDGDSICSQNTSTDYYSSRGCFIWGNAFLGQRFNLLNNFGVGGETTADILARNSTTLATDAKYVHYIMGKNDIEQARTFADITADMLTIFEDTILKAGKIVIVATIIPGESDTEAESLLINKVNNWIKEQSQNLDNYIVVDYHKSVVDQSTSLAKTDYTVDGTHPSVVGAYSMGVEFYNTLENIIPVISNSNNTNVRDANQIVVNSLFLGGATLAPTWTFQNYTVASKEILSNGDEVQVLTNDNTTDFITAYQSLYDYDGFSIGDTVSGLIELEITDVTDLDSIVPNITVRDASSVIHQVDALRLEGSQTIRFPNEVFTVTLVTPKFDVPVGAVRLIPYFFAKLNGTVKVNKFQIFNHST